MECKYSLFRSVMESADNDSHKEEVGHKDPPPNPKEFHLGRFDKTLPAIENFEGYKLKQGTEGSWRVRLSTMVYRHRPSKSQSSIHHLRLFSEMNMLVVDPWSIRTIMTVRVFAILDDGCLHRITYSSTREKVGEFEKIMTLYPPRRGRSLPPSVQFIHPTCAVVCDGGRVLNIYETNEDRTTWESFFEHRVIGPQAPGTQPGCDRPPPGFDFGFVIVDARLTMPKQQIDVCLRGVRDYDDKPSENIIRWISIWMPDPNCHNWVLKREKTIVCPGDLEFVGFDRNCDHLITVAAKPPAVESDEKVTSILRDPALVQVMRDRDNDTGDKILYCWYQTSEEVKVWCRLEKDTSYLFKKEDITFEVTDNHLKIMAGGEVVIDGELGGMIDAASTEWELLKPTEGTRRLQFSFKKKGESPRGSIGRMWLEVVKGDGRGKFIEDLDDLDWSMQALDVEFVDNDLPITYWTAAKDRAKTSSSEKMEECDIDEAPRYIWYLNETTNNIDHVSDITGHPVLFATRAFPPLCQTRALCIRDDDHGYVYNFEIFPPRHIQNIKIWGYVQQGKPNRRYTGVSPHGGYGVVVDFRETAFAYWQTNAQTHGEINQYKEVAGREDHPDDAHCPMQVVHMRKNPADEEVDDEILGYVSTEDTLFLLSSDTLVIHRLRVPPVDWARSAAEAKLDTE